MLFRSVRSPRLPDVPTIAEAAGIPGFAESEWFGVLVPAATPKGVVTQLHDDIAAVLKSPDVAKVLTDAGFTVVANSPEEFGQTVANDTAKWTAIRKEFNIK